MSLDWNLSSDEEDDFEHWVDEQKISLPVAAALKVDDRSDSDGDDHDDNNTHNDYDWRPATTSTAASMAFPSDYDDTTTTINVRDGDRNNDGDDDGDDDNDVDWEDVGENADDHNDGGGMNGSSKLAANQENDIMMNDPRFAKLKAVTIDMGGDGRTTKSCDGKKTRQERDDDNNKKKRKRSMMSKTVFRHGQLPPDLQTFLNNVQMTHLLCLSSHAVYASQYASDEECLHVAHSLIPTAWMSDTDDNRNHNKKPGGYSTVSVAGRTAAPTITDLNHWVQWFVQFVSSGQRQAATATRGTIRGGWRDGTTTWNSAINHPTRYQSKGNKNKKKSRKVNPSDQSSNGSDHENGNESATIRYRILDYCSYLSNQHENWNAPKMYNEYDHILLFLAMTRSMQWRVRYVMALEPMERDLDVDHPLFVSMSHRNVFLGFWRAVTYQGRVNKHNDQNPVVLLDDDNNDVGEQHKLEEKCVKNGKSNEKVIKKRAAPSKIQSAKVVSDRPSPSLTSSSIDKDSNDIPPNPLCWVEVLCRVDQPAQHHQQEHKKKKDPNSNKNNAINHQWVHIDLPFGVVNQPHLVEQRLYANHQRVPVLTSSLRQKRLPIPYALAVEHLTKTPSLSSSKSIANECTTDSDSSNNSNLVLRMTDVTRRYASSMVDTVRARGVTQNKTSNHFSGDDKEAGMKATMTMDSVNEWWSDFLYRMNHRRGDNKKKQQTTTKNNNKVRSDALSPSPDKLKIMQSKGDSCDNAVTLDDSDDDERKDVEPPSATLVTPGSPSTKVDSNGVRARREADPGGDDEDDDDAFHRDLDHAEETSLQQSATKEPIPTSKAAFKKHPLYVIRSVLTSTEVLVPDAKKRVCGIFKGELVFLRRDVETALPAKKWLYRGRKVKDVELKRPTLRVKARKKPVNAQQGFKALKTYGVGKGNDGSEESREQQILEGSEPLGDGMIDLFGKWQTDPWSPPYVGPHDPIPINEYRNIELDLINPGLVHIGDLERVAMVAKTLDIPYAPCLLGFEGHGGNRTPTIKGIVIHLHNEELLREAHAEMYNHLIQQEHEQRQKSILLRWKRLMMGVLTKDRLENEYDE